MKMFDLFWDGVPKLITKLKNLTHLEMYLQSPDEEGQRINSIEGPGRHPENYASYLPRLSYTRIWGRRFGITSWKRLTFNPNYPDTPRWTSLEGSRDQSFKSECWGDFFLVPKMVNKYGHVMQVPDAPNMAACYSRDKRGFKENVTIDNNSVMMFNSLYS